MANVHRAGSPTPQINLRTSEVIPFEPRERRAKLSDSPLTLARLIEGEIIPRLMMAHQSPGRAVTPAGATGDITPTDVSRFVRLSLVEEFDVLMQHVDGFLERGVEVEAIYFDLLGPVAKRLGIMWEEDDCSFTDVTVGLCRLQQIVHELSGRTPPPVQTMERRHALFALTPGDQHTFGLVLVTEFFKRAGWSTVTAPDGTDDDLIDLVASQSFDVIGFSVADEQWLEPLPSLIARLRAASRNPLVRVMVGGRVFVERPERCAEVGADATGEDARQAVLKAGLLADRPSRLA
jgi:methanogenic corrinoid protein MtbC1